MINKVHDIVLTDLRMKFKEIDEIANISIERVHNIFTERGVKTVWRHIFGALLAHV